MKDRRLQYLLVSGLIILLGVLAFFQYKWVSQISQTERERLQKRVEIDARFFADDFDRVLQTAYFNFQIDGSGLENTFLGQYQIWQQNSPYPQLIKGFDLITPNRELGFDLESAEFIPKGTSSKFSDLNNNFEPIDETGLRLTMPIYDQLSRLAFVRRHAGEIERNELMHPELPVPKIVAYLVIELDQDVIKNQILSDLTKKYFPEGDYQISIYSKKQNASLFQTEKFESVDASIALFELLPDNLAFLASRELLTTLGNSGEKKRFIFDQRVESNLTTSKQDKDGTLQIKVIKENKGPAIEQSPGGSDGRWILGVRHLNGSITQFVDKSRRDNLLLSFGILGLLGSSIGLILFSANRAQMLAQRQLDFVSSVSHEFRTPIAVIYSAAENLADGVAREEIQVSRYGRLIKGEGKKLSGMVEQILDFAGARSGQKKYDFREIELSSAVEDAIKNCQPLIDEKHFEVDLEIPAGLPLIVADTTEISRAVQNLIINSIKYSGDQNWLRISVRRSGNDVEIIVEDKGIGITKKDVRQIFTPFYRAKEVVDAQIHGNGLGLSLVKQTIDAHRGQVRVESEVGKGSRFVLRLPINLKDRT